MRTVIWVFLCFGILLGAGCSKAKKTDDLIRDLKSDNEGDRIKAVRWLQHRQGDAKKVVPVLIESLEDEHADIRWSAAIGLGYFGKEATSAIPALEGMEEDKDARVRQAAKTAIERIKG